MLAAEFGSGQALWSIMWFFLFFIWIMILFQVFGDIFRSKDLGGVAKALWIIFVILTPYLGVFVYLIARGGKMAERQVAVVAQQQAAAETYIRDVAGSGGPATELAKLTELKDKGAIDDAEYQALKAKILA